MAGPSTAARQREEVWEFDMTADLHTWSVDRKESLRWEDQACLVHQSPGEGQAVP